MDLKLIELIHKITQAGYEIKFNEDFDGMVRIDYFKEFDSDFYEHEHVGYPGQSREKLKLGIEKSLENFEKKHRKS
jgi:hypothetical protein